MYKSVHAPNLGRAGPNLLSYPLPLKVRHLSLPAQTSSRIRGRASTPTACEEKGGQEGTPNVALALAVAPLLIPLKALCQEQSTIADLSSASPEIVSLVSSTLAIPVVIFGAMPDRPYSPRTNEQVAALQAEYEAKMKSLKGSQETARPLTRPQKSRDQAEDMAAEYAAKLAMLHEESAARAEGDLRKKQKRYAMLADLQSQAQMSRTPSPREVQSSQQRDSKDINLLAGMRNRMQLLEESLAEA
ncbi:hypothetical protein WJX79_006994 [Trebouxia sp. C0005]